MFKNVWVMDADGQPEGVTGDGHLRSAWSRTGPRSRTRYDAVTETGGTSFALGDLWSVARTGQQAQAADGGRGKPQWSPDGSRSYTAQR